MLAFTPPTSGTLIMVSMAASAIALVLLGIRRSKKGRK